MEMNHLRAESHVAQKNRRHKLRFQHNSGDPTHHHLPQDPHFESFPFGSISYDPIILPSGLQNPIAGDQDSGPDPRPAKPMIAGTPQDSGGWKTLVGSPQPLQITGFYPDVGPVCVDQPDPNSCYGYTQDLHSDPRHHGEASGFGPMPFYQNTLQEVVSSVTLPHLDRGSGPFGFVANGLGRDHGPETIRMGANGPNWPTQGLSLSLSSVPPSKKELLNPHLGLSGPISGPIRPIRNVGPLGPFTGYATILKNSKYLKPAQELLNENCDVRGHELTQKCEDTHNVLEEEMGRASDEPAGRPVNESGRPEFHQKKAKLLSMQEEVCRRYKQYQHQMQAVISSFETVAGLSAATPFVALAVRSVSRHFKSVKNAISEQVKKTLEDLCSPSGEAFDFGPTTNAAAAAAARDRSYEAHGRSVGGGAAGFFGTQPPVWRPQRGLPERAVAVLKAWLFDHFLHPYPSDADKHMLAMQTGLTRNQVSNWFINARVRIWKPMVEEIHTLETKGLAQSNPSVDMSPSTNRRPPEGSRDSETLMNRGDERAWDHDKRYQQILPAGLDRRFVTAGGPGLVSLTLGLRQNAENVQQDQQQLRQRFGGQLIQDFVG